MASNIDITKPANNSLLVSSELRTLAATAKSEIEALQAQIGNGVGQGVSYFITATASDVATYDVMSRLPDSAAETSDSVVVNNSTALLEVYIGDALERTAIPAGVWSYDLYLYATPSTGTTYITAELYKRTTGGTETLLFSVNSPEINATTVANYVLKTVQQNFACNVSDRLVLKITATTNHNANVTVTIVHSGTAHYSHIVTPLAVETSQSIGDLIAGSTAKTTPVDADLLGLSDSADSNRLKKLSWANLKAALKTYFDSIYISLAVLFNNPVAPTGTSGWRDMLGSIVVTNAIGSNDPTWTSFIGGISAYAFSATLSREVFVFFHIDHDYKPSGAIHIHAHWSTTGTNTGVCRWGFEYTIAKGHNQGAASTFPATTTVYIEEAASGVANRHHISEVVASITNANCEPDSTILVRIFRDAAHANDTLTDAAFLLFADCHYETDRLATLNKAPNFYV